MFATHQCECSNEVGASGDTKFRRLAIVGHDEAAIDADIARERRRPQPAHDQRSGSFCDAAAFDDARERRYAAEYRDAQHGNDAKKHHRAERDRRTKQRDATDDRWRTDDASNDWFA